MTRNLLLTLPVIGRGLLFGGLLIVLPPHANSQTEQNPTPNTQVVMSKGAGFKSVPLELGQPVERKLDSSESHSFDLSLAQGHFIHIVAEQRGVDLALALFNPSGRQIVDVNNRQTERGSEAVYFIAEQSGTYRLEVRSPRKNTPAGTYQIAIERSQPATTTDQQLVAAEQLIADGDALLKENTKESAAQAIAKYERALPVFEAHGDLQLKALNKIGRTYFSLSDYQKALDYYQQALMLARAAADFQTQAETLTNAGDAYRLTTENDTAMEYLSQALQVWQTIQDRRGEAKALDVLARVYLQMGNHYKSIFCFDQALQLSEVLSDPDLKVETLGGMGLSYYAVGDNEKAIELWKRELVLVRSGHQPGREANVLEKVGSAYNALGNKEEALNHLNQAIKLARDRGDRVDEALSLQTIGRVYRSGGEPRKAIEYLEQSLVLLKDANNPPTSVARAHYNLGKAYTDLGEYQTAIDYLDQALVVWKSRSDPLNIAATIRELARAERGRGHLETALAQSETALNLMEGIRSRAGGSELRASYLAIVQDCFELRVDVLTRLHKLHPSGNYAAMALQTSESARARSLLETLVEAGVDIRRDVSRDLLKREQRITQDLSAKAAEQARLFGQKSVEDSFVRVSEEVKDLSYQYERVEAEIRAASPRYASLTQPRPLTLAQIREQVIDDRTLLLEYYLGQERSYLWAVTATSIESFELPKRAVIESAARRVYRLLTVRNRRVKFETIEERHARFAKADAEYPEAANALTEIVLRPVARQLGNRRLLIVSDGALQYVPFAALPTPSAKGSPSLAPLAIGHEIVALPSASTLAILRQNIKTRPVAPKTIAILADPVFDGNDERVKESVARNKISTPVPALSVARRNAAISINEIEQSAAESGWDGEKLSLARLPFTRREADAIKALVPAVDRKTDLDFSASLANAKSLDLSQYRIIHFATHGFLNSRHPELSGLVLSLVNEEGKEQDGFLRSHEVYDLKLPAELIVLSGCRTGLGKEIKGEGLVGLTRAFMHAGSARVLVSLWDVNDEATAELMTRFYRRLLGDEKLSPAAALHAAQISMANDEHWSAPYFWAGFILLGEPR
jgi:CHAT domain-containing protein/Tfp pilus assembly protein PilF